MQVGIRAILQHLGQARVQIHGVVGRLPVRRLAQPVSHPIIRIAGCYSYPAHTDQPIGPVVGVTVFSIPEQVAVVIPGIVHTVVSDQPVCIIVAELE